jgi:tetratricopeptide (TPR) repeat protein
MSSFREREEYQEWRAAVFQRFGTTCILCGHSRNIHAHHVKPVKQFPEKAFDVGNGAPLCGNCHADVNGKEAEYELRIVARQKEVDKCAMSHTERGGDSPGRNVDRVSLERIRKLFSGTIFHYRSDSSDDPKSDDDSTLKQRAIDNPHDSDAVRSWFQCANDAQAVVDFYNRNRERFKKDGWIYLNLAGALVPLKRFDEAIQCYGAGLRRFARDGWSDDAIANMAWSIGTDNLVMVDGNLCVQLFRSLLQEFEGRSFPSRFVSMALASFGTGGAKSDECLEHAKRAVELEGNSFDNCLWLGKILEARASLNESLTIQEGARALAKDDRQASIAVTNIAIVLPRLQRTEAAVEAFEQALSLDGANFEARSKFAGTLCNLKRYEDAYAQASRCLAVKDDDALSQRVVARSSQGLGRFDEAINAYRKAAALARSSAARSQLAWFLATCPVAELRDGDEAVTLATEACEEDGWQSWGRIDTLAAAYAECGKFDKAIQFQEKAASLAAQASDKECCEERRRLYSNNLPYRIPDESSSK